MIPGEYFLSEKPIIANAEKNTISLNVQNTGDRPVQVGSHAHFFEVNKALEFPRRKSYGFHLNSFRIPMGLSLRPAMGFPLGSSSDPLSHPHGTRRTRTAPQGL